MKHERAAYVQVDGEAITHNVRALRSLTSPGTLFMAVVKADGYGHGAVLAARAALAGGADRLGVATVREAVELREGGLTVPIQLLSEPPAQAVDLLLEHDVIPTVTTREFAGALGRAAASRGIDARYHLKIDTGMNRIGVPAAEAHRVAAALAAFPGLRLEGVFTHFATADLPGDWDFENQRDRFEEAVERIRGEGVDPGIVHAANSPATVFHPETHYAMVRCGIAIYGLQPSVEEADPVGLRPAMRVAAHVTLVKRIGMGEGVSYGLTWRAAAPATIATLPLGYADGVHRVLSGSFDVLIGGVRCPQVGRVCMDQMMVEVPRGVDVAVGSEAVIVGEQGSERMGMEEIAARAGTINYEMACAFGMRLPRVAR